MLLNCRKLIGVLRDKYVMVLVVTIRTRYKLVNTSLVRHRTWANFVKRTKRKSFSIPSSSALAEFFNLDPSLIVLLTDTMLIIIANQY